MKPTWLADEGWYLQHSYVTHRPALDDALLRRRLEAVFFFLRYLTYSIYDLLRFSMYHIWDAYCFWQGVWFELKHGVLRRFFASALLHHMVMPFSSRLSSEK